MTDLVKNVAVCILTFILMHSGFLHSQLPPAKFITLTEKDGLSNNWIKSLMQDKEGFIWVGTLGGGLDRYDGHDFKNYQNIREDSTSISSNAITDLYQDKNGIIWIATYGGGLNRFDPVTETFKTYAHDPDDVNSIAHNSMEAIFEDEQGNLWIGTFGGLCLMDRDKETFQSWKILKDGDSGKEETESDRIFEVKEDSEDPEILWLGGSYGLYQFNKQTFEYKRIALLPESAFPVYDLELNSDATTWVGTKYGLYSLDNKTGQVHSPIDSYENQSINIFDIVRKSEDELWIASYNRGVGIFNERSGQYHFYDQDLIGKNTIANRNEATVMLKDRSGILWIGLGNGLSRIDSRNQLFNHLSLPSGPGEGSGQMNVTAVETHPTENKLYAGSWQGEGLYIIDRESGDINTIPYISTNERHHWDSWQLDQPIYITDLLYSESGQLWIASSLGFFLFNDRTNKIEPVRSSSGAIIFPNTVILSLTEDRFGNIWIGSRENGLAKINALNRKITYYKHDPDDPNSLNYDYFISPITEDKFGKIWVGTQKGVSVFNPETGQFTNRKYAGIADFAKDNEGNIWASPFRGYLIRIDPALPLSEGIKEYTAADNLPNSVGGMVRDHNGNFWCATGKGIAKLDPTTLKFKIFDSKDGLKFDNADATGENSLAVLPTGEIAFGIPGGITYFHPDSLQDNLYIPPPVLTSFEVFYEEMSFDKNINHVNEINLPYEQNSFSFRFAALNYTHSDKNQYAYQLEGVDKDWVMSGNRNFASYTQVDDGCYTFRLKVANNDGIWNENEKTIKITIAPPWWRSTLAYIFYGLMVVLFFAAIYWFQSLNRRLARAEAHRLRELDAAKTRLYTNITHEFRTPLTVILGMADKVVKDPKDWLSEGVKMIKRNGLHLLNLVNQMLDLAKMQSGSLPIHKVQGNIIPYLKYLTESFHTYAESKGISLHFLTETDHLNMDYDPEKMLNIISNLLSNAIKFTPENGNIYIHISEIKDTENDILQVKIKDTGIGIAAEKLPYIFDRFYQVDDTQTRQGEGTGIGLTLTRELVKLLEGNIEVNSKPGKGSVFTIKLPIHQEAEKEDILNKEVIREKTLSFSVPRNEVGSVVTTSLVSESNNPLPLLLIVEDSPDVVKYLYACLEEDYQLVSAPNGQIGIEKAQELIPDIIISDVMMPEKDGFEVCETLKTDERTSHIPIILLTAKADIESKISGLKRGADAYLAKPFNQNELKVRLEQLVELRQTLQSRYRRSPLQEIPVKDIAYEIEDAFLERIRALIYRDLSDSDLDVSYLAKKMAMSRSQLFRKIKALTGESPSVFIRTIRLHHAKKLLETSHLNVSEIAYDVGFSNPAYFTKLFREMFGVPPGVFREKREG